MRLFYLILFSLMINQPAKAQQKQAAWWMFGDSLEINFNNQPLTVDTGIVAATALFYSADATISDANGNLLFYSNGLDVMNRDRQVMPYGNLFPTNQILRSHANLIVEKPGSQSEYYFFNAYGIVQTRQFNLTYNIIDMNLDGGKGDVVQGSKNISLLAKSGAYLAVLQHINNSDYWLVASSIGFDTLFTFPITAAGIGQPTFTPLLLPIFSLRPKLKSSPNSQWLAATNNRGVELFQFNRATGAIIPFVSLTTGVFSPNLPVLSVAFSTDNKILYAGEAGIQSKLYQFDLSSGSQTSIQNSMLLIDSLQTTRISDMQLGIDGKLYLLQARQTLLGVPSSWLSKIHCPNLRGSACRLQKQGINLYGRFGGDLLPSLNQTLFRNAHKLQALAMRDTICYGDSVQLSAFGAAADRFRWFPAGTADTLASLYVRPLQTTIYTVIGFSACRQDTAQVTVTVLPALAPKTIGGPVSVCPGVQQVMYRLANPQPGERYRWGIKGGSIANSFGDSAAVNWNALNASAAVWVVPQNSRGCFGDTAFLPVQVELALATPTPVGPTTVCATGQAEQYEVQPKVNGSIYTWGISGGSILSGQGSSRISVSWQRSGSKKLWVQETSQTLLASCRGLSDTLHISLLSEDTTRLSILAVSVDSVDEAVVNIRYSISPDSLFPLTNLHLERQTTGSWQSVVALPLQSTAATDAGVNAKEQRYRYRLQSRNRCDSLLLSSPHATVLLKAANEDKNEAKLSWSGYKGWGNSGISYEIWRKTEGEAAYRLLPELTTTDTTLKAVVAGAGFSQCFKVRAVGQGQHSWSNSVCLSFENLPEFSNIITPNQDGLNDAFIIRNLNLYPQSRLQIFNRWGSEVYRSDDYRNNWQAAGQSSGVYFYRLTTVNGSSYKGWVEVVK